MQPLTEALKKQFGVQKGVLVSEVLSGDPADKAGVKAGDVIMKVGDKEVRTPHDVQFAVLAYKPGDKIRLLIDRGGKRKTVFVVAREKEAGKETASIHSQDDLLNKLGMALEAGDEGVVVMGVVQGSPADIAQIQRGDVIVQVNRKNVKTVDDVVKALSKSRNGMAVFYIDRRGSKFFVAVPLTVGNK
jgi:S1-C subfamily serine protease